MSEVEDPVEQQPGLTDEEERALIALLRGRSTLPTSPIRCG